MVQEHFNQPQQQQHPVSNPLRELLDSNPSALDGCLSYEFGLCAPKPLSKLTGSYQLLEEWARKLPVLYQTGAYREYFDSQPLLSMEDLSDGDLLRANQILGLAAHATVHFSTFKLSAKVCPHSGGGSRIHSLGPQAGGRNAPSKCPFAPPRAIRKVSSTPNQAPNRHPCPKQTSKNNTRSEDRVPEAIMKPWREVNLRLGRPKPTFTYYDYFTLNVIPKSQDRTQVWTSNRTPVETYTKLMSDVQVFGDHGENVFVLVNHDMEYQSTPLIRLCTQAVDCVIGRDDEGLTSVLQQMGLVVKTVTRTFLQANPNSLSNNFVDPVGWSKSIGMLIPPILEGEFSMSGLQSSFVHLMDVFLERFDYSGEIGDLALNERPWLPSLHQEFFRRLQLVSVRAYICQSQSRALKSSFDRLVRLFASDSGFLGVHRIKTMGFLELGVKTGRTESSGRTAQADNTMGWQARVWRKVNLDLYEGIKERMQLQCNSAADGFTEAFVQSIEEQGAPGSQSYKIIFNITGAGLLYKAGDRLEVMPANSPQIISRMLKALHVSPMDLADSSLLVAAENDEWKYAVATAYEKMKGEASFPIAAILRIMHLRPLTKNIYDSICQATGMVGHIKIERALRKGKIHDVPELIELIRDVQTGNGRLTSEALHELPRKLCSILPPLKPRLYSIANSPPPGGSPSILSIVVSRLWFEADSVVAPGKRHGVGLWSSDPTAQFEISNDEFGDMSERLEDVSESSCLSEMDNSCNFLRSSMVSESRFIRGSRSAQSQVGTTHIGVCTSFLLNHSLFQYVPIKIVEEDSFHLPPVSDNSPLIFVALGSGAAPMFAFLEELLDRGIDDCPTQVYFFWGLRYSRNLFGVPLLKRAMEEFGNRIKICISFSGEDKCVRTTNHKLQIVSGKKERITTTMQRGEWAKMLAQLVLQKGYLYLCGHPMLETSMCDVLKTALVASLGYSPKQSSAKYEQMVADRRIRADCFFSGSVHDPSLPGFSYSDVAQHNNTDDIWWIFKDHVYNVTEYLKLHPGGLKILFDKGGRDATADFEVAHGRDNLRIESMMIPYRIGNLKVPEMDSFADKKAYNLAVSLLHKIVEIRNVFALDVNIFPSCQEASGIAHSLSMRFKTHEKFITSVVPMLERAFHEFINALESEVPRSRLIRLRRAFLAKLTAMANEQLPPLLAKNDSPGTLCYVATELCQIERDFLDEVLQMTIGFVSSIEHQLIMRCHDESPDVRFAPLKKVCDKTVQDLTSRLGAVASVDAGRTLQVESFKHVLGSKGALWGETASRLSTSQLLCLKLRSGDYIYRSGDSLSCIFYVVSGVALMEDKEHELGELKSGALMGALTNSLQSSFTQHKLGMEEMGHSAKVTSKDCLLLVLPILQVTSIQQQLREEPPRFPREKSKYWQRLRFKIRAVIALKTMMRKATIRRSSLSAFLSEESCQKLASTCSEVLVSAGDKLCESSPGSDYYWILISGAVHVQRHGKTELSYHYYGQIVGSNPPSSLPTAPMLDGSNLVAVQNCRLLCISGDAIMVCRGPLRQMWTTLDWIHQRLLSHPAFSKMLPHKLLVLVGAFRQVGIRKGEPLLEREAGASCFLISSGKFHKHAMMADKELARGDFCGLDQFFSSRPIRNCTYACVEQAVCWTVSRITVEKLLGPELLAVCWPESPNVDECEDSGSSDGVPMFTESSDSDSVDTSNCGLEVT